MIAILFFSIGLMAQLLAVSAVLLLVGKVTRGASKQI